MYFKFLIFNHCSTKHETDFFRRTNTILIIINILASGACLRHAHVCMVVEDNKVPIGHVGGVKTKQEALQTSGVDSQNS